MHIGEKTIAKTVDMFHNHLRDYQPGIEEAYCRADNTLEVTLKVKYSAAKMGIKIDTQIAFVAEKIKDTSSGYCDEQQLELVMPPRRAKPLVRKEVDCGYSEGLKRRLRGLNHR